MWIFWLSVSLIFFIAEKINKGFFLIWFSTGALLSLLISFATSHIISQLIVFLLSSLLLLISFKRYSLKYCTKDSFISSIDLLIGQTGTVIERIGDTPSQVGRVKLDGEIWSAISYDYTTIDKGESVIVDDINGVRLIVHKKEFPTSQDPY